jgi:hypothetical protein
LEIAAVSEVDDGVSSAAGVISYDLESIEERGTVRLGSLVSSL